MPRYDADALVREAEWRKCAADIVYWTNNYVYVVALDQGGRVLMDTSDRPYQVEGLTMLADPSQRRIITLKSRQVGFSSYTQGKLIHECTLQERVEAMVVAHDRNTGEKLYQMGERIYSNLPDDPELKPKHGRHRRSKFLHFAGDGL